jgi:dolichyl-phosphate-mannose--protein O-mannosyl transferase
VAGLGRPVGLVFDEIWYARNACRYVIGTAECGIEGLASRAHPPLGNWMIGAGIKAFGFDEFGWRIAAAVAGTIGVAFLYVLVRRLLRNAASPRAATVGAFAAAGLLAADFLHLVLSRVAMLDVFVTTFVIAAILFAVLDTERQRPPPWEARPPGVLSLLALDRPWRLLAGASIGAAAAVKWAGAYVALAVIALIVVREIAARRWPHDTVARERPWREATWLAIREEVPRSVVLLGIVPVAVYLAAYIGRMPGEVLGLPWADGTFWRNVWEHQADMLRFHTTLAGHHPYESPPWSWLLLKRPVTLWFSSEADGYREILAVGNPLVWWAGLIALIGSGVSWARAGWGVARPEPVLIGAALAVLLPWLVLSGSRSQTFIWYVLPAIPFLYGAIGLWAARIWQPALGKVAVAAGAAATLAAFVFFFPILTALPMAPDAWRSRIPFADCARPDGEPTLILPNDEINAGPPPIGWCWI